MEEEVILKIEYVDKKKDFIWILCTLDCARNYVRKHKNMAAHKEKYYVFRDDNYIDYIYYEDVDVEIVTDSKYIAEFKIIYPDKYYGDFGIYEEIENRYKDFKSKWDYVV